ncbi:MAG TPA: DUF4139 domain-containing protein [Candidatus Krumholzibacteria bacterium]|nr:DUF4139 domain-containing protein [Candidatus Krumholzibacteria bacterium]HPD72798.1 DUF4139 domain-containing protein [Candidatus Krumholzibacteria bacterium]HRY40270.1 DUF4139 domain-containing protein [Candidatus Krumholzibacteria bacterium]
MFACKPLRIFLIVACAVAASAVAGAADTVTSAPEQRATLELTVYNQDLALVREVRGASLPAGEFALEIQGVPERIQPATLLVEAKGRTGLVILEQNYEFDLMSKEKILEKYVGREIAWIQENGERTTGRLLGMTAGPVYEVGGEVVFEVPGRIALPQLPENLRARPTLVWRARTERAGEADLDVSYLTGGLAWNADYVLQLDPAGKQADLKGWVTVENRSGAGFANATLQLVAGEINQVRGGETMVDEIRYMAKAEAAPQVVEETLYDYHLYTVPWATTLPDNSSKQVSLLDASGLAVERHYTVRGGSHYFRGGQADDRQDVAVSYSFENSERNRLGMPLPAGTMRVYGQSQAGKRQLLGEDRIRHTPKDETIELDVGKAFDLVAERVRKDYRRVSDRVHRNTWEITLRNHKDEDVTIDVREQVGGDWEVLQSSVPHEKVSAQEILFRVPVQRDGETVLTYTVEVTY